jgi:DinB superfamily
MTESFVRELVAKALGWEEAHVAFDAAVDEIPENLRGTRAGAHSPWELVEHIRITQHDILDFSRNPDYKEMKWPDNYWPRASGPASSADWDRSLAEFRRDRESLRQMALDTSLDLTRKIPHGDGQTYLRELLLVADHTAYHVGQLVLVRQLLGIWKK